MDLYLLNFNNYYNRTVKFYGLLSAYRDFLSAPYEIGDANPIRKVNFIPNDGVAAEQVINWGGQNPDYVIVAEDNTIVSRWFVIESVRLRSGQYKLSLYRDLVADYYNEIVKAPMFVEKGYVSKYDPAIFNSENMTFNQIKKKEQLLKDPTKSAWIVGYMVPGDGNPANLETITYGGLPKADIIIPTLEDWEYYDLLETDQAWTIKDNTNYKLRIKDFEGINENVEVEFNDKGNIAVNYTEWTLDAEGGYSIENDDKIADLQKIGASNSLNTTAMSQLGVDTITQSEVNKLERLQGKIAQVGLDKYYRLHVNSSTGRGEYKDIKSGTNLFNSLTTLIAAFKTGTDVIGGEPNNQSFQISTEVYIANIFMEAITISEGFTASIPGNRPILQDAPYSMFCIPYSDEYQIKTANGTFTTSKLNCLALATGIARSLGGIEGTTKLYDIQLLPYCPIPLLRENGTLIDLTDTEITKNLFYRVYEDSKTAYFFADYSSGSFDITYNYYYSHNNLNTKIKAMTEFWRLCSPNYNGVFEFNPWKNQGTNSFNVDYTYKPYQPYIHINPNFKNLYGKDFNDARGLICGGDFGLPVMEDAWRDYELSNKNYNAIFNRQIENMETTNRAQRQIEEVQAWVGAIQGGVSGGVAGGMGFGNPYAAVIGAAVGGMASYSAGQSQIAINERLRNEAIDYTKDQFGYQLGNIKALPQSLSRVSAFNANNKIFPFIEFYDATDEEKAALENKLKYNGMTIMRIGTLKEFIPYIPDIEGWDYGYFKGQIIRLEGIDDDSHIVNAIASELNKGVYIP